MAKSKRYFYARYVVPIEAPSQEEAQKELEKLEGNDFLELCEFVEWTEDPPPSWSVS